MDILEVIQKKLQSLKAEAIEKLNELPEPFNDLEDSENYNYFQGILTTVNSLENLIIEETQRELKEAIKNN